MVLARAALLLSLVLPATPAAIAPAFARAFTATVTSLFDGPDHILPYFSATGRLSFSLPAQAAAVAFADGTTLVALRNATVAMECEIDTRTRRCISFCPLSPNEPLLPFSVGVNATDEGPSVWGKNATKVELWRTVLAEWLGIVFITEEQFVDQSRLSDARLLHSSSVLHNLFDAKLPLGKGNNSYTAWDSSPPPASDFFVDHLDRCPFSFSCNELKRQLFRLATHQHLVSMEYYVREALAVEAASVGEGGPLAAKVKAWRESHA